MTRAAFDIDGTLISGRGELNFDVVEAMFALDKLGVEVVVWSGGGGDYANQIVRKFGLPFKAHGKGDVKVDIAFDDQVVALATVNITIKQ